MALLLLEVDLRIPLIVVTRSFVWVFIEVQQLLLPGDFGCKVK